MTERTLDRWAAMVPEAVAEGSKAQVIFALSDAKKDIAMISGQLRLMSMTAVGAEKEADEAYKEIKRLRYALMEIAEYYEKNFVEGSKEYQAALVARSALSGGSA